VLSDLESEGYETATFIIPACAVNAPHRRDRVWVVAHAAGKRLEGGVDQARQVARCGKGEVESRLDGILNGLAYWVDLYNWPAPLGSEQYDWEPPRTILVKPPFWKERIKALGNAVVPLIPYVIGTAIREIDKCCKNKSEM
jgi:site-specific DNA-cytosine methylase